MHLDGLYTTDPMSVNAGMGLYTGDQHQVYASEQYGMGMDMSMGMYGFEVDPVVSSQGQQNQEGYMHAPKPMRTPTATEASFADGLGSSF